MNLLTLAYTLVFCMILVPVLCFLWVLALPIGQQQSISKAWSLILDNVWP